MKLGTLLALAWRESRFARRRLFLFLSAISLGVAALVAVQGFAANMSRGVREQARTLLGADLVLRSRQPLGEGAVALIDSLTATGAQSARLTSFASMAMFPGAGTSRLVQVRAPQPGYPYYGGIETAPAGLWDELQRGRNALVDPALLTALGAVPGDSIALGEARFRVLGALVKVPGDVELASAFAPRVFVPARYLGETELLGFGSRVEYEAYLRLPRPELADALDEAYQPMLRSERVRARTAAEQQEGLEETLGNLSNYLGLVGVFALLLGGIGVASAMSAYMAQKVDTVAVLRCIGATSRQVFAIYLVQAGVMGLLGALVGVTLGAAVQWVLPRLMEGMLPIDVEITLDGLSMLTGMAVGVWTALAFALLPLLGIRRVSPLGALRRRVEPLEQPGGDRARAAVWTLLGASVLLLLVAQVGNVMVGTGMAVGVAATLAVLWAAAWAAMRGLRRLRHGRLTYTLRQGLANLYRPGNQTRTVVLALGFGVFLLATLLLTQENLLAPLRTDGAATRANMLFWDVQDDQAPGVMALIEEHGHPVLQRAPIVPMRVAEINGVPVRPWTEDEQAAAEAEAEAGEEGGGRGGPDGWAIRREYRSTYRDSLVASERLLRGKWWEAGVAGVAPVSLEEEIAEDLDVAIGDTITWDVQGVRVPTVVGSIRRVDWARFEPNFFAVFPTDALRGAPQTWVILTHVAAATERAAVQHQVIQRHSNVAVLDLTQVQQALDEVLGRVSTVIRFLAAFSIATGFVVLLGAVSSSRLQRLREGVLLKTLGATRRQIGTILFVEYLLLGALAALVGVGLALAAGWALARLWFDVPFAASLPPLAGLGALVSLLSVAVGLWASQEVFRRTPMEAIREE